VQGRKRVCFVNLVIPAPGDWYTEGPGEGSRRGADIGRTRYALPASDSAKFIDVSREAIRGKHQRHEVLGLKGGKMGLRFSR
jgi:hypothetical protein